MIYWVPNPASNGHDTRLNPKPIRLGELKSPNQLGLFLINSQIKFIFNFDESTSQE